MTTSGTYAFNPSLTDLTLLAYARCGVRRTAVVREHMEDARLEMNLMLAEMANKGPNLWSVVLHTEALLPGIATYDVPPQAVMILDAFISTTTGGVATDRIISPVSRTEYASYPNKDQRGYPSVFWFDRQISPAITLWQVPDDTQIYTLKYYMYTQMQDAGLAGGINADMPYRFIDAFVAGLAVRLAQIYAPDRLQMLRAEADRTWAIAASQDVENVPMYITPGLNGYFRP